MASAKIRAFTENTALATASAFTLVPVICFILGSLSLIIKVPLSSWHLPLAFLISMAVSVWICKSYLGTLHVPAITTAMLLFLAISIWGIMHFNVVYDNSYDGIWYHQEAVINLYRGWNPFYEWPTQLPSKTEGPFYAVHYPKASWVAGAIVYKFTHGLESAKVLNLWWAVAFGFWSFYILYAKTRIPLYAIILLTILALFNPVSIYQVYSFYVDGQMGAGLMILILLLVLNLMSPNRVILLLSALVFIYVANLKFTGLVYATAICGCYMLYILFMRRQVFIRQALVFIAAGILAVIVFGYPTYVTNTITNKHPMYPIMGPESFGDVIRAIPQSANFKGKNRFEKYYLATFANPVYCRAPMESTPKKLFSDLPYWGYFTRADFEMSGFGPYYAECYIFLIAGLLLLLVLKIPDKKSILLLLLGIVTVSFMNSEVWYARYAPQLWLAGLLIVFALFRHKVARYYALFLCIGFLYNVGILAGIYFNARIAESVALRRQLNALKLLDRPAKIFRGWQVTFDVKAAEFNLPYVFMNDSAVNRDDYQTFIGFNEGAWAMFEKKEMEEARAVAAGK